MLVITVLQVGAAALLCSAWYRTTFGAFIGSYAICAAIMLGPMLVFLFASLFNPGLSISSLDRWVWQQRSVAGAAVFQHRDSLLFPFFAPMQLFDYEWNLPSGGMRMAIAPGRGDALGAGLRRQPQDGIRPLLRTEREISDLTNAELAKHHSDGRPDGALLFSRSSTSLSLF